jgi:hypothetical protein
MVVTNAGPSAVSRYRSIFTREPAVFAKLSQRIGSGRSRTAST